MSTTLYLGLSVYLICRLSFAHMLSHVRSSRLHRLKPTRFLCPWDSPGKNTRVGCHCLLQWIFPTQGWNPHLHCRWILCCLSYQGSLCVCVCVCVCYVYVYIYIYAMYILHLHKPVISCWALYLFLLTTQCSL